MSTRFIFFAFVLMLSPAIYAFPTAKVTINVVDEGGVPVEGANVEVYFKLEGNRDNRDEGVTDSKGLFEATGSTQRFVGGCNITKDGYYASGCDYSEKYLTDISGIMGFRRWQPWNPSIKVVLKPIKNPIPLYMRYLGERSRLGDSANTMPDYEVGFDLVESDWVAPHGRGIHSDFIFKLEKNHISDSNFHDVLTISFANEDDGIQAYFADKDNDSVFKMPYHAPTAGYKSSYTQVYRIDPDEIIKSPFRIDQNYFFRVRTERDSEGKIISALYGKIEGYIRFAAPSEIETAWLRFKYFINPTPNNTNLEFDETQNLFGSKFVKK